MTWLITCIFTFLHICLMSSKAMLFPPTNLTVNLLDFMATAEWLPAPGNPVDTRYTLEFIPAQSISGGKWNRSPKCTDIATLKCDLTFDQQSQEPFSNYFVRVKTTFKETSSNWTTTLKSFQPYGDTRLSSPDIDISTEHNNITISFSHRLELYQGIMPLEFLICLFERDSMGSDSKCVAQPLTSQSPYIFSDVPTGKNYCVNVSASHQQALRKNNFNTTKCFFLSDSSRSAAGVIGLIVAMVVVTALMVTLIFMYFYRKRFKMEHLHIPGALSVFAGTKMILNLCPENMNVITLMWSNADTYTEECASASEENDSLFYHPRDCVPGVIMNSSSVFKQEPAGCLAYPIEEAESLKRTFTDYVLATNMEEHEENFISEADDGTSHSGDTAAFTSVSNLSLFTESETPQLHTVRINLDRDAEETESRCEMCPHASDEEDDVSFCDDSFSYDSYEPRADPRVLFHDV